MDDPIRSNKMVNGGKRQRRSSSCPPPPSKSSNDPEQTLHTPLQQRNPSLQMFPKPTQSHHLKPKYDNSRTMNRVRKTFMGDSKTVPICDENDYTQNMKILHFLHSDIEHSMIRKEDYDCPPSSPLSLSLHSHTSSKHLFTLNAITQVMQQIPAVALIGIFHLMIGIPFGVSYFPIGWRSDYADNTNSQEQDDSHINGQFPLDGKEAFGIRMFLLSTIIGQMSYTLASGFSNPIGLQMVENVPFYHTLAGIVITKVGYGKDALSTLLVIFGLSSISVGVAFFTLGYFELGNVVYFFPSHVMVGCIGGIGLFIAKTGIEVTTCAVMSVSSMLERWDGMLWVMVFEGVLRILERVTMDKDGKPRIPLLSPIYFCLITPVFYFALWIGDISMDSAKDRNYFFPSLDGSSSGDETAGTTMFQSIFNKDVLEMWTVIDVSTVSWSAIIHSVPTLIALVLFSLIHVPINIPAFAISTKTEADMNRELVAHGYSNVMAGLCGGLQNYMAYTQSVVYDRSGGDGKASGIAVALVTTLLFFVGPAIASYLPRCMASTILLHFGVDLFLEGVYDSFGKFDTLEYVGVWVITFVMTFFGMNAAIVAGAISAVATYTVQTVVHLHPIRGSMSAVTLRSSVRNMNRKATEILDGKDGGRGRILVVQLQGHLFFGNVAQLNESVNELLLGESRKSEGEEAEERDDMVIKPWILIMDFSLVLGIDTSATQAIVKLRDAVIKATDVTLCIFVTGSDDGFPCEFNLSHELSDEENKKNVTQNSTAVNEETALLSANDVGKSYGQTTESAILNLVRYEGSHVFDSMDSALAFAEKALIYRADPFLLITPMPPSPSQLALLHAKTDSTVQSPDEKCSLVERATALRYLENICPPNSTASEVESLFSRFQRQTYRKDEYLWRQGSEGDRAVLLVYGTLVALLENEAGTKETVESGHMLGELGLVMKDDRVLRMNSVVCVTEEAVVYSLSKEDWEELTKEDPKVARFVDYICISYLANRVQHVSNRIFETRCLPI